MLLIRTHLGSIADPAVGAHAVLNASNPEVALGSGVSGAIRTACGGAAFQKEIRERLMEEFGGSLESDDCLVTSAGCAQSFRWVLHVAAVNYRKADPETGGVSGPLRIETCFRAALAAAESLAIREGLQDSFIFATPLLGAGHGGLGPVIAAEVMIGTVRRFMAETGQDCSIAEIIFAVMTENDRRLIRLAGERFGVKIDHKT
ncbi:MAG TPA: macro domain-containing protein [Acidobacteriota bacterium]|nr:macro domain-containing protein [Acidobacteriota bacterium]